jgi:hypothetical protein
MAQQQVIVVGQVVVEQLLEQAWALQAKLSIVVIRSPEDKKSRNRRTFI